MRYFSLIITILLIGLSSCGDKKVDEPDQVPVFLVTPDDIPTIASSGGSYNLSVTSSDEWEVEINDQGSEWVSVTPAYGTKGTTPLKISVTENLTYDNRTANIVFKSGSITKTLSILQNQNDIMEIEKKSYQVPSAESSIKIYMKSNLEYSVSVSEEWLHIVNSKALVTDSISVVIDKNITGQDRKGTLEFKAGDITDVVTINQSAGLILSTEAIPEFGSDGGTFSLDLSSDTEWEITMDDRLNGWLDVTPIKGDGGSYKITLTASKNTTGVSKSGEITIRSLYDSISLSVSQKQNDVMEIEQKSYQVLSATSTINIYVKSNLDYTVSTSEEWLHITNSKAIVDDSVSVVIDKNITGQDRKGTLEFKAGDITEVVTINQSAGLILSTATIPEFGSDGGTFSLDLSSDTEWEITMDDKLKGWLNVTPTKGDAGSYKITLTALKNISGIGKSGEITFRSLHDSISLSVSQKQNNILEIPQKAFTVVAKGCDLKIQLTTNIKYELTVQESWIHILDSIDPESNVISVKIDKNSTGEKRTATLTIKGEGMSESIIITQEANISSGGTIDDMPIEKL